MPMTTRMRFPPDEPISPPSHNEVDDEAIEILSRLTLFTTDLDLDP